MKDIPITERAKIATINFIFYIAAIALSSAFLSTALLRIEAFKKMINIFPGFTKLLSFVQYYGFIITGGIIGLCILCKMRRNLLKALWLTIKAPFHLFGIGINKSKKMQQEKSLNKIQEIIHQEEKAPYSLIVPLDLLPENTGYRENKVLSNVQYEDAVKRAFKRIGLMNEEDIQEVRVKAVKEGPQAVQITITVPDGTTISKIRNESEDLMHAFSVPSIQITPARAGMINIVLFFEQRRFVVLKDILKDAKVQAHIKRAKLPIVIGVNPIGEPICIDLAEEPHLLVAGTTGSGKSVFDEQALITLLMAKSPKELKLVLIDPKIVELDAFKEFPHTLRVATEPRDSAILLKEMCREMDRRYAYMGKKNCRNIDQFYSKYPWQKEELPLIVILIDELADLMTVAKNEVESSILRIVQKARAAGIHLITATQRPSVDVVTGLIKANLPGRIVFQLNSAADYRTILDKGIQTELMGKGDGIADISKERGYVRFQSPSVGLTENEREQAIERIRNFWIEWIKKQSNEAEKTDSIAIYRKEDENHRESFFVSKAIEKDHELVFKHGSGRLIEKLVPASDFSEGTSVEEDEYEEFDTFQREEKDDLFEDTEDENSDPDVYIRLQILHKIRKEKNKQKGQVIIYAPSSNELTRELGIRKSTVLEHYNDMLKEKILEKHVNRRYIIVASDEDIEQLIESQEKMLQFINE